MGRITRPVRHRQMYYWIVAYPPDSRPVLILGGTSSEEARMKGLEMLVGMNFNIRELPTRDVPTASRMIKGSRLEDSHDLNGSMTRLTHERGLRRRRQRR